jgi:hypothetical protein
MRIALTLFALYVASERTIPHPCHFEEARNGWAALPLQYKDGLEFKLFGVWERWDACWYARIATFGYTRDGSTAFFPLFPTLERIVALGGPHVIVAGMLVNAIAAVLALWGLYRIVARDRGDVTARRAMLLLAIFPAAVFLLAPFSEAIYLALAVWMIERARRGAWIAVAILATLAGIARPVGVFLALPLAWLAYSDLRSGRPLAQAGVLDLVAHSDLARGGPARSAPVLDLVASRLALRAVGTAPRSARPGDVWPLIATLAAPLSALAYVVYTDRVIRRSMFEASAEWTGSAFHPPWEVVGATFEWIGRTGDPLQALQLALLVVFAALFLVGIRRLPVELTLYAAPHVYLVWARILPTPLTSTARYMLVIFPIFIVLAMLLEDRRARWSYAILSLLLLGALANELVIGNFIG